MNNYNLCKKSDSHKKESTTKKATELKQILKEKNFNPMQDHKKATDIANEILKVDPDHKDAQKVIKDMKAYESPQLFQ